MEIITNLIKNDYKVINKVISNKMSQNNNTRYVSDQRYSYNSPQPTTPPNTITPNNNPYQSTQPPTNSTLLLPYHQYMAQQMKGLSTSLPVAPQPTLQPLPSLQPLPTLQPLPSHHHPSYPSPLQPLPPYYQQPVYHYPNQYPNPYPVGQYPYYQHPPQYAYYGQQQQPQPQQSQNSYYPNPLPSVEDTTRKGTTTQGMGGSTMAQSGNLHDQGKSKPLQQVRKTTMDPISPMKNNTELNHKQKRQSPSPYKNNNQQKKSYHSQPNQTKHNNNNSYNNNSNNSYKSTKAQQPQQKRSNPTQYQPQRSNYNNQRHYQQQEAYNIDLSSNEGWSQQEQQQQALYQKYHSRRHPSYPSQSKTKPLAKKKDTILDDPQDIRKWIQARRRNYPGLRKKQLKQQQLQHQSLINDENACQDDREKQRQKQEEYENEKEREKQEMSKLESKIRKRLLIINGDSRSVMKKIRNIEVLRRIVQDPRVLKRERKNYNNSNSNNSGNNNNNGNNRYNNGNNNNNNTHGNNTYTNKNPTIEPTPNSTTTIPQPTQLPLSTPPTIPTSTHPTNTSPILHTQTDILIPSNNLIEEIQEEQQGEVQQGEHIEENVIKAVQNELESGSESDESIEPEEVPANKVPKVFLGQEPMVEELLVDEEIALVEEGNTRLLSDRQSQPIPNQLFEFVQKQQSAPTLPKPSTLPTHQQPTNNTPNPNRRQPAYDNPNRRQLKPLDPQTIIAHLKQKQRQDRQSLNSLFDYKSNSYNYNYRVQTLQTSLKLDEIFAETTYLLQAIRYIVKENFLEEKSK